MASNLNTARGLLVPLWFFALWSVWGIFINNGGADMVNEVLARKTPVLPETKAPLKTHFTGVKPIDDQLALLAVNFWQAVDGSHPTLSLFGFFFAGEAAAEFILLLIEGARAGNRGRLISYTVVIGLLAQNATFASTLPLYILLHFSTSPTATPRAATAASALRDLVVQSKDIYIIPVSVLLGFFVPIVLMSLPAPTLIGFELKQDMMALWQIFPVNVSVVQLLLTTLSSLFLSSSTWSTPATAKATNTTLRANKIGYVTAISIALTTRIATFTLISLNTFFPLLFPPEYRGVFSLTRVMVPRAITPWSYTPARIGDGGLILFQYDEICTAVGVVVWAGTLYFQAEAGAGKGGKGTMSWWDTIRVLGAGVLTFVLAGPVGLATLALWRRDERCLRRAQESESGGKKVQ